MTQDHALQATAQNEQRRAYQKPEFRFETVFETMALACGKIAGTQASCTSRPSAS